MCAVVPEEAARKVRYVFLRSYLHADYVSSAGSSKLGDTYFYCQGCGHRCNSENILHIHQKRPVYKLEERNEHVAGS